MGESAIPSLGCMAHLCRAITIAVLAVALAMVIPVSAQETTYNEDLENSLPTERISAEAEGTQEFRKITADRKNDSLFILASSTFSTLNKYGHDGTLLWSRNYDLGSEGRISSILYAKDAVYSIGYAGNVTHQTSVLLKHDGNGSLVWQKPIDATRLYGLDYASDSIFVTGNLGPSFLVQRYDKDGNMVWSKAWMEGTGYSIDAFLASIYVTGTVGSDEDERTAVLKFSLDGDILWERTLQDSYPNYAFDIVVYGGKVYVTGYSTEKSPVPLMLAAYDFDGNLLWRKSWTGVWGHLNGVDLESGGIGLGLALYKRHLYLAGEFSQPGDVLLQKYDLDGNVVTTSTWDCCDHVIVPGLHNRTGFDAANDIVIDNGVAWAAGKSIDPGLDSSSLLLKYDLRNRL